MHAVVLYLPLVVSAVLGVCGPRLSSNVPPATAVRLFTVGAFAVALATGFNLFVLAFLLLAQLPWLAGVGHWSIAVVHAADNVPPVVAAAGGIAVIVLAIAVTVRLIRFGRNLWAAHKACRHLRSDLVVVGDGMTDAFALPGGRIVISTGMLRALPAAERRVLLAHEMSHVRHRHYLYVLVTDLAAAADPLLRPLSRSVRAAVERWADEDAAAATGNRRLTARAVARAGLAPASHSSGQPGSSPPHWLATAAPRIASGRVVARVNALLEPPPAPRRLLSLAVAFVVIIAGLTSLQASNDTDSVFRRAEAHYHGHS
jgi:hypothetical protein